MRAILRACKLKWNSLPRYYAFVYSLILLGLILVVLGISYGLILSFFSVVAIIGIEARVSAIKEKHKQIDQELKDMLKW